MSLSTLFTQAHKQARNIVRLVGDYKIAFSISLKKAYEMIKNTVTTVETYNGTRKVDIENKMIAMADGSMVAYALDGLMHHEGETFARYKVAAGVIAVTVASDRKLHEISDAQKASNLQDAAVANVMSEGQGDY
jgi:phage gp37-like protein